MPRATGAICIGRARHLCKQLGSPPQLVPVLYGQYVDHLVQGEMDLAHNFIAEMLDLGQSQRDALLGLLGTMCGGTTSFWMGDFGGGSANTARAFSLCDPLRRAAYARVATLDVPLHARAARSGTRTPGSGCHLRARTLSHSRVRPRPRFLYRLVRQCRARAAHGRRRVKVTRR